jgi:DNA (cytosine-5)-methyltransferase 1
MRARRVPVVRILSLCTGYGGLDLAVEAVLGARTVYTAEIDDQAARVTAARFPDAPNLGDIKLIDWKTLDDVDIITAGYPCQPFSQAGRRRGEDDPRHIWPWIADAIRVVRPRLVILENVRGHLSKGFGTVIGELADIGYDARWTCVRAADVGAPHRRERVFIVARAANPDGAGWGRAARQPITGGGSPTDGFGPAEPRRRGSDGGATADAERGTTQLRRGTGELPGETREARGEARKQRCGDAARHSGAAATGTGNNRLKRHPELDSETHTGLDREHRRHADRRSVEDGRRPDMGVYEPAVARWEHITGRLAPSPVDEAGRLSPLFVEWMMGLPAGWVTDVDLPVSKRATTRGPMLKILGNGVVPQQAEHALRLLLDIEAAS